jgi:hypothetical protein
MAQEVLPSASDATHDDIAKHGKSQQGIKIYWAGSEGGQPANLE